MDASSSSSSSGRRWKYDVFLNFRGEDTRKIFVSHLYKALDQKAIKTFIDAEELRKGNHLLELLKAIQESRVSIVVFSQNYASSSWCLKELVQILECMDTEKHIVVPIFYQVDPSHVRKLKRSFAEAFARYEHDSKAEMEEVQSWRSALTRAADLSGWDSRNYGDDAKLIDEIVQDIFDKLVHISSSKAAKEIGLVGMDSHMYEMYLRLCPGLDDVRCVGIWGMGGIGKTTIARAVYHEIACQFEACCFLENVKQGFSKKGAVRMQEKLLSRILKEKVRSIGSLDRGFNMIMERLSSKKVILVLDDVDNLAQIETLLGKQHSFGGGSRIIITTRDMQLLSGVDAIYGPNGLSGSAALELFRQYAFITNQCTGEYDHLSKRAIKYAQGLPLALTVLGAFLDNKSVLEWEDVLEKIKKIPQMGVQDVLRTSFDGLDDSEKNIFLDIACFFKEMDKDYATEILADCGFFPHSGLRVLVDRALVTISCDSCKLEMHDLLQEMGQEIVRQESIREPGRRSRLWNYEDVHHVFTQNTATEAVESIMLNLSNSKEVYFNAETFVRMTKLRLLKIQCNSDCLIIGDLNLKFLSHELRCFIWPGCPLKSLPSNFNPENLLDLDVPYSDIEQLWEGTKPLTKLKYIRLHHCQYLKKTPDFTHAINMGVLNLEGCIRLLEVHPSIFSLENLDFLSLEGCKELKVLPNSIRMKSLSFLCLSGCSNLEKFPDIPELMENLSSLDLEGTAIKELPSSIKNLTGLRWLELRDCKELKSLPNNIVHLKSLDDYLPLSGCSNLEKFPEISEIMENLSLLDLEGTAIKELPSSIKNLTRLETLQLKHCTKLMSLPESIVHLKSLNVLNLCGCLKFEKFPEISEIMEKLSKLCLKMTAIKELPSSIKNLTRLETLKLHSCREFISLPNSIVNLKYLKAIDLSECSSFEKFPEISEIMDGMSELYLGSTAIKELPLSIKNLTGLLVLDLSDCRELESLPSRIFDIKSLEELDLTGCSNLEKFPEVSNIVGELSVLRLKETAIKELPSSIKNLMRLTALHLEDCKELKRIPSSIFYMNSLEVVDLSGCSNLEMFPEVSNTENRLSKLCLDGTAIKELPYSIKNLTGLVTLKLRDCRELKSLPSSFCELRFLRYVSLSGCTKFEAFPNIQESMGQLRELHLDETSIKEIFPSVVERLPGLHILNLRNCTSLVRLPDNIFNLVGLRFLNLSGCTNLSKLPVNLGYSESSWDNVVKQEMWQPVWGR